MATVLLAWVGAILVASACNSMMSAAVTLLISVSAILDESTWRRAIEWRTQID
jgi:hypothetical protein